MMKKPFASFAPCGAIADVLMIEADPALAALFAAALADEGYSVSCLSSDRTRR